MNYCGVKRLVLSFVVLPVVVVVVAVVVHHHLDDCFILMMIVLQYPSIDRRLNFGTKKFRDFDVS